MKGQVDLSFCAGFLDSELPRLGRIFKPPKSEDTSLKAFCVENKYFVLKF